MGIIDRAMIRRARVDITSSLKGVTRTCFRFIAALALCLGAAGAHALSITFDHYFEGLTPNSDGVYVIEPGTTLEYRVAINLEDTRASSSDSQATYTTWWRQATLSLKFNEGGASTGDFAAALPGNASSEVIHRRLLTLPAAGGEDFFRTFRWTYRDIFGTRSYTLQMAAAGRASDAEKASAGMLLRVSKTAAATLVRPTDAARMERVASDQLVLSGATIPTVNSTRTDGVELEMPLSITSPHWSGDGAQEFNPPTIVISPNPLRIRFSSPEPDVKMEFVNSDRQVIAGVETRALPTSFDSMDNAETIARFHITDGGADAFPALVERLSLEVDVSGSGAISDDVLRAFNFRLVNLDDDAPEAARVSQTMTFEGSGGDLRLVADLSASPISLGGSTRSVTVYYGVRAYLRDTSVAVDDSASNNFALDFDDNSLVLGAGSGLSAINPDGGNFDVSVVVWADRFHITGVETKDLSGSSGFYRVGDAYPALRLTGEWRDQHGNVDADVPDSMSTIVAAITKIGGASASANVEPSAFSATTIDFDDDALVPFTMAITDTFGVDDDDSDPADGSRWSIAVTLNENPASAAQQFTLDILAQSFAVSNLRIMQPFSHGVVSALTFDSAFIGIDGLRDRASMTIAVSPSCSGGLSVCSEAPSVLSPAAEVSQGRLRLRPSLTDATADASDRMLDITLGITAGSVQLDASHFAGDSQVESFVILPPPMSTLTVSVSEGSDNFLNTDGSYASVAEITIARTDPDRSDDRYTKATFSVSQLDAVLVQDRTGARLEDVEVSLHTASGVTAAEISGNSATESVSLSPSGYTLSPGLLIQGPTLRLRYIAPTGVDESGAIGVSSLEFTLTQNPAAADNVVVVNQVGLLANNDGNGIKNGIGVEVDATKIVGAELETSAGCRRDPADKTFASGNTLTCIEQARLRVKTQVQYQDANNNVDTAARSHSWHLVDLTPPNPITEQELVAATAGDVGRVPMRGAFGGKADKSRFRLEARATDLTPFALPFTLDFKNSAATLTKPGFGSSPMLRHQAPVTLPGITVMLSNTYTNTHDADVSLLALSVFADCETTSGGASADGCSAVSFTWNGQTVANEGYITFEHNGAGAGASFLINGLSMTPTLDLGALRGIGVANADLRISVRVYRRDNDAGAVYSNSDDYIFLGEEMSDMVSVQGQAAELSYSVSAADDRSLDSVGNVGMANLKKIADITIEDGGTDTLSGRITGINIANDSTRVVFVLRVNDDPNTAPTYPMTVADSGSVALDLHAYIPSSAANDVIDGLEVAATLEIQAASTSGSGGSNLHSTLSAAAPAPILADLSVVATQVRFNAASVSGLNNRKWDIRSPAEVADLELRLSVTDASGNRRLQHGGLTRVMAFYSAAHPSGTGGVVFPAGYYEFASSSIDDGDDGVSEINMEIGNLPLTFRDNLGDGSMLTLHYWDSEIGGRTELSGLTVELNYIADASEISTATSSLMPSPAVSAQEATLAGVTLRAYNTWSGQTDLDASPGANGDISDQIEAGVSCDYPVTSGTPECEITAVTAVATDDDDDGVWIFTDGIVFTPALTGDAPVPRRTAGRLDLNVALPWALPDSAHNFTAPAAAMISSAAFTAVKPIVVGFVQNLYMITEAQQARVCIGVLFGSIPVDAGNLILTLTADDDASEAERGSDFNFAPMELTMSGANQGDMCADIDIIDDKLPENTESVQINVSAEWETSNEVPLSVSPVETMIEVADDDNIRVRVEAGRLDDNGVFSAADAVMEDSTDADPLLLRVSFWTDEDPPQPFSDNLGGERTLLIEGGADSDSAQLSRSGACMSASQLTGSEDVCVSEYGDDADIEMTTTAAAASSGFDAAVSTDYARNGRHEFYIEILARLDEEVEGAETLTFAATTLYVQDSMPDIDAAYIPDPRNTTFTVRVTDGEAPEVRYFLTATGERVNEITAFEESTLSYRVGIYDKNTGEALALKEAFSFSLGVIGDPLSVVRWVAGAGVAVDASVITFTFAAGAAADLMFSIFAFDDTDSVSEQGGLQYSYGSGATNIEHPASFALTVVDNDDGVSPSACVGAIDSIDALPAESARDAAQADCLRVASAGAFGFTLEWDEARDRQDVGPSATALMALTNADPYTIYLVEQADGACPNAPPRPTLRQTAAGLSGGAVPVSTAYPDGYDLAASAVTGFSVAITEALDTTGDRVAIKADTRYCAILRVSDSAWVDWAPQPVVVRTVAYSTADADGNGVPDHLDPDGTYADLDAYLSAQCAGTSLSDYDCDGDDVPDVLELRFGRAADVSISPMALNCRANSLRTRLAADLPSLTCSGATTALDAISDQTLVHAADNQVPAAEPGGVVINVADPDMLGEEMFLPGRYWLSGDTADSVVNLGLERAVEISAPEVTALDADLIVRGRGLGAKLTPSLQQITAHLSHSTPVETIQASGLLFLGDPPQIGAVASGVTNFRLGDLSPLLGRTEVTELLLRMTWTDEVGDGVLQQRILISRPGTTPTLFVPSSEAGMLSIAGGGTFLDDGVLTLAEESSAQTLMVSVDSRPSVSADRWTLTVAGADPTMAPLYFTDSTDTRRAGLTLNQASLDLPLAFLLSLDLALPARLLISWSGEESGADHGAHAVVLIFAPGSTPTAAAKTALLDGYRLGGHYRDGETPREVRPGPGAKIRLGDYAAQRCLQEPDVCSGREELPDRGLGLSAAGDARHPACPRLGAAALPCLDFQLFCDASADECMSGGAVDVVFPLNAPLRADHWLYYSQPRALDGAGRTCPFVQTGMPAHVRPVAGCPGTDQTPAFRSEPIYPDRIYAAPDSIASACPPIGDTSWRSLAEMQDSGADLSTVNCLRVAYSDGGPNDSAPNEAALIADPMGVGAPGAAADGFDPLAGNFGSGGGGGALGVFALLALLALTLLSLISTGERSGRRPNPAFLAILLALTLGAAPQARAADWKVFDDAADFFGEVFSGDFFAEGAWATGLDLALSGFDRDISGVQEDADDNDYGFRLRGHWDQDGVWGEGLAAELWWADLGSAALRPDGGGEEVDFDYEAYGLGLTWGWALPRFDWLSIGGFDLNPNHVFAGGGWRDIDVADADGDGAYFTTGLSWNVGEWFNAPGEEWSLRVSYDVFDSEGVDYFAIGLTHRFGAAQARPAASRAEVGKRLPRRARRGALASCGEWDACACQRPINKDARGWYVQVATYSDNGLAVARKRMRQLREAGYREVGLRDNGRGLHALRVSVRGDCREAEALKGRLDALLNVDSMLRGWKDRPY